MGIQLFDSSSRGAKLIETLSAMHNSFPHASSTEKGTLSSFAPLDESRLVGVPLAAVQQVDDLCDRFEQAWKSGSEPRLGQFLQELPDVDRATLLRELTPIEIHYRRSDDGRQLSHVDLIAIHPELADELAVIATESAAISPDTSREGRSSTSPRGESPLPIASLAPRERRARGLQIRCPSCRTHVELISDTPYDEVACGTCGSNFSLIDRAQATEDASTLQTIGRFELISRLGLGGFGTVWKARDTDLDRTVALKIPRKGQLREAEVDHFFREARAAAQLRHPHIVSVFEIGRVDDVVFIVSDYVRGVSLSSWMDAEQPDVYAVARIGAALADALDHAHGRGVIHRDVKPSNVLIDDEGRPHLMDFGLAKRDAGEIAVTREGQILGTAAYMSPEQASGRAFAVDCRTDIYALGVILFQMATDELPYRGNYEMQLRKKINDDATDPRRLNQRLPRDFATICLKCLERDRERRYANAAMLRDELLRLVEGKPVLARPISRPERVVRWAKRKPAAALLAALTMGVAVGGPAAALVIEHQRQVIADQLQERDIEVAQKQTQLMQAGDVERDLNHRLNALSGLDPQVAEFVPGWRRKLIAEVVELHAQKASDALAKPDLASAEKVQIHLGLAMLLGELGRVAEAIDHFDGARRLLEEMHHEAPDDTRIRVVLADCTAQMAEFYTAAGVADQAQARAEQAAALRDELARASHRPPGIDVDRLASLFDRTARVVDPQSKKSLLEGAAPLRQQILDRWPTDSEGIYRAACHLTLRDPLWAIP